MEHGNVDPDGDIEVVRERNGAATISGGTRLGPGVASVAVVEVMDCAETHGVGTVAVRDGNHVGMAGYYTDELQWEGLVGLTVTNAAPAMAPHGGAEPVLGMNPIAIGLPIDPPFNLDMATSAISRGVVHRLQEAGERLPEGVALDAEGQPMTDPAAALEGSVRPFDGAKGSGLALAIELLAGGLTGAAMGEDARGTFDTSEPCTKGDLFLAIDPTVLSDGFSVRASPFLSNLQDQEPAADANGVRIPGARSIEGDRTATSVELDDAVWDEIRSLASD